MSCPHKQQIRIRKPAPKFTAQAVVNGEFKTVSLDDFKGKYVYLFFYPLDFTFVCPTEIISFSERAEEFKKIGCEIIACSVDSQFSHLAWVNTPRKQGGLGGINFPIVSDLTHQIAKDYGVFIEEDGHTIRGSFIIGADGLVKQITLNDNPVGRSVDEALRLVEAYQYTDVHGEVCPANWTKGGKTMIPDSKQSKTFFESTY
ncbi:peroxiredoxin [Cavenderia fasciculata]|uniref:thioredoxin-dependent peroxiredoxin n=1 Tax=Cavenderia fasciculata TaxID=261658 RepID=F4PXH3_CACFS|nr:peroxiredoxin [Cavenderia fasciculata]EGG19483.1 peroxiredoxin [Cavenderia fasciculata]|eukprot:XP_004357777.1 peroxiredoxin [Cavenderia fasciculata]